MSDNNKSTGEHQDASFGDFLNSLEGKESEEKVEEEVIEEEDSQEEEVQDETDQKDEDDSQEEEEEEASASEEGEEEEDDDLDDDEGEEGEEDPRDAIIAKMQQKLDDLEKKVEKPATPPKEEKEEPPPLPDDLQQRILGDLDIDDVTSDPKLFMQVIQNALVAGRDMTYEHVMKSVPKLVIQQTRGYQDLMAMQRRFYKQNKDLRSFKSVVANAANEVHSEHPEWSIEQVLDEAAKVARKTIGITKKKGKQDNPPRDKGKKQKPAFAKTPKKTEVKKQVSKLQQDIAETLDL